MHYDQIVILPSRLHSHYNEQYKTNVNIYNKKAGIFNQKRPKISETGTNYLLFTILLVQISYNSAVYARNFQDLSSIDTVKYPRTS